MSKTELTDGQLLERCDYWKNKLGLSHWRTRVQIVKKDDLPLADIRACNEFDIKTEEAVISLCAPCDYEDIFPQDMERDLVHELLHIPMRYIATPKEGSMGWIHMEATIERLANLLVKMERDAQLS